MAMRGQPLQREAELTARASGLRPVPGHRLVDGDKLSLVELQNKIATLEGAEAMGNHKSSAAMHQFFRGLHNGGLGMEINRARGFIEDQDGTIAQEGAGQ